MALIPDVKCSRCDRRYSGLLTRCPHCGARRHKKGKRITPGDNKTLKLIISALLFILLVVAVIVLAVSDRGSDTPDSSGSSSSPVSDSSVTDDTSNTGSTDNTGDTSGTDNTGDTPSDSGSSGENSSAGTSSSDDGGTSSESGSSSEAPTGIQSVTITYLNDPRDDITMQMDEVLQLGFSTTPASDDMTATWASSDDNVFTVTQSGVLTAVGEGEAELTVTVEGVTARCIIRVN